MQVIKTIAEMQQQSLDWKRQGLTIGFVPTMGYLHEGHLSLIDLASERCDKVVVSIFVNPKQFGPNEDFTNYPRDEDGDLAELKERNVDVAFLPPESEFYPESFETVVTCTRLPAHLCGLRRKGHFDGVTTVVAKLFNATMPDVAVFGEKDYQQLLVLQRMTRDLNLPIEVLGGPTIREEDGLAMSSRNAYLAPEDRKAAASLFAALQKARQLVTSGMVDAIMVRQKMTDIIEQAGGKIDYVAILDPHDLNELETIKDKAHAAVAVFIGSARLIDNMRLKG
jgi:pantoate--beta-alanine ligase